MGLSREQISRLLESSVDLQGLQDPEDFFRGRSSTVGALGDHRTRQAAGQRPTMGLAWHIRSPERRLVPLIQPQEEELGDMMDSLALGNTETAKLNSSSVPELRPCYVDMTFKAPEVKQKKGPVKERKNAKRVQKYRDRESSTIITDYDHQLPKLEETRKQLRFSSLGGESRFDEEDTIYEDDGLEDSEEGFDDNTLDDEMIMRAERRQQGSESVESREAADTPDTPDTPDSVKAKETAALNSSLPKTLVPKLRPCYVNITEVKQQKSLHKENTKEKKEDTIYENDGLEEDSEQVSDDNTLDNEMMMRAARRQQGSEIEESWEAPDTPDCATDKRQVMVERYRDRLSSLLLSDTGVTVSLDEVARRLRFTSLADNPKQESREVRKTVRIKFQGDEQTKDKIQELGAYRREMKLKMKPMVARRQVGFRRRALQVSVGGSEEQVRAALGEGRSRQQLHAKARLASIRETGL